MNDLYRAIMDKLSEKTGFKSKSTFAFSGEMSEKIFIIPPNRNRYLAEISENNRSYDAWVNSQKEIAQKIYALKVSVDTIQKTTLEDKDRLLKSLNETIQALQLELDPKNWILIENWQLKKETYKNPEYKFKVRGKELTILTHTESLSHTQIPKIALAKV
jgi:methylmalonyl-CoA mutase